MKNCSILVSIATCCLVFGLSVNADGAGMNTPQSEMLFENPMNGLDRQFDICDTSELSMVITAAMDCYHIPGLSACIIKNGNSIWDNAYGWAVFEPAIETADTTLFNVASVSKTFVGIALMQLWENNLFELDDNINDYLSFDVTNPNFPDSVISFRMLLSHTSGILDSPELPDSIWIYGGDSPIPLGYFLEQYLTPGGEYYSVTYNYSTWSPGTDWGYSNIAVALAAYLVEVISGVPFDQYCEDNIFTPLDMYETSWFLSELNIDNIAMPYVYYAGNYYPLGHYGYPHYPSAQLRTSTPQLARYLTAFMQYGKIDDISILDSTTVELMTTVQYPDIVPGWGQAWGLCWHQEQLGSRLLWGHRGGGFNTFMFFSPDENTGVVIQVNRGSEDAIILIAHLLFEYAEDHTSVDDGNNTYPEKFIFSQSYPNPFNSTSNIIFDLFESAEVRLEIYNILGQHLETLIDKHLNAGNHIVNWDAGGYSSGLYFYKLTTANESLIRRMTLIK